MAAVSREKRIFRKTKRYGERLDNLDDVAANEAGRMMSYIYANYDAFKLIVCCSEGAEYADYVERLIDIETKSGIALIHKMQSEKNACTDIDDKTVHILSNVYFSGVFEVIRP